MTTPYWLILILTVCVTVLLFVNTLVLLHLLGGPRSALSGVKPRQHHTPVVTTPPLDPNAAAITAALRTREQMLKDFENLRKHAAGKGLAANRGEQPPPPVRREEKPRTSVRLRCAAPLMPTEGPIDPYAQYADKDAQIDG